MRNDICMVDGCKKPMVVDIRGIYRCADCYLDDLIRCGKASKMTMLMHKKLQESGNEMRDLRKTR